MMGRSVVLLLLVWPAACREPHPAPPLETAAGIGPLAVIRSPDSAGISFDRLGQVRLTSDSSLVVALPLQQQLVVLAATGGLRAVLGRPGAGPGEFRTISAYGVRNDSVWVYDPLLRRLTWFSPAGRLLGSEALDIPLPGWPRPARVLALLADGHLLVEGEHSPGGPGRGLPTEVAFGVARPNGQGARVLGTRDLSGTSFSAPGVVGLQPFRAPPLIVAAPDGSGFATVTPDPGVPGRILVRRYRPDGAIVLEHTHDFEPAELTAERVDSAFRYLGPPFPSLTPDVIERPAYLPTVSAALLSTDGRLWLSLDPWNLGRAVSRWVILDRDGRVADTLALPAAQQVVLAGPDWYWAIVRDSLDLPELHQYPAGRGTR